MPTNTQLFKKYKNNNIFIETGSLVGQGIEQALEAGFDKILSIELSEWHYVVCMNKFYSNSKVNLFLGDSSVILKNIIDQIDQPATFWLDGHYSGGNTAKGEKESPLMEELEIIKNHKIKNHTIIIDDMRCWIKNNNTCFFDKLDIENKLKEINPNYILLYENGVQEKNIFPNDILIATIKDDI